MNKPSQCECNEFKCENLSRPDSRRAEDKTKTYKQVAIIGQSVEDCLCPNKKIK